MIAILMLVLNLILMGRVNADVAIVVIPEKPSVSPAVMEEQEWSEYHAEAVSEYADEFTALFNSYETKWSKNNRLMIRKGNTGSYTFAKRSK